MSELAAEIKPARRELLGHALRLEYLTVGWNVVEGVVAVAAALAASSVALLGQRFSPHPLSRGPGFPR